MHAMVMTEPAPGLERTEIQESPEPRPGPGEVSIDVAYAGINFFDVMARRGDPGYAPSWPYVPGLEVAGTIRETGPDVAGLSPGERVAAFTRGGGLAEIATADAALVVPLPSDVAFPAAAAAPLVLSTALLLLDNVARFRPGERVLMHSASGGIGSAVAQLVPTLGGGVRIGTVGGPDKVTAARDSGWDVTVVRGDQVVETVRAAVGDVDIILDPSGTSLLDIDLELVAPGGRIVLFGNPGGAQLAPLPPLGRLVGGNVSIAGFSISRLAVTDPGRVASALQRSLQLLADGRLDLAVTEVDSLDQVPAVHQLLAEGGGAGKYVVAVAPRA